MSILDEIKEINPKIHEVLVERLREAEACKLGGNFFSASILYATIIEGFISTMKEAEAECMEIQHYPDQGEKLERSQLAELATYARTQKWLSNASYNFISALREMRNWIHPREQARSGTRITESHCEMARVTALNTLSELRSALGDIGKQRDFLFEMPRSLIGRDAELAKLQDLIESSRQGQFRVISVIGPPGSGKTVLVEHALRNRNLQKLRIISIDLSSVTSTLELEAKESWYRKLIDTSSQGEVIAVLHSCEHLVDKLREKIPKLLALNSHLVIVATSTRLLNLPREEYVFKVSGLKTVGGGARSEAAYLIHTKIFERFPNWVPSNSASSDLEELGRKLDGLPLAICMSIAQMSNPDDLNIVISKLEGQQPGGEASESSAILEDVFSHSYELLKTDERYTLEVFASFSEGVPLELLYSAPEESGLKVSKDVILALKNSTWISTDDDYAWMLSSARRYIRKKASQPRIIDFQIRILELLLQSTFQKGLGVLSLETVNLDFVEREQRNIHDLMESLLIAQGRSDLIFAAVVALGWYWNSRGYVELGYRIMSHVCNSIVTVGSMPEIEALRTLGVLARDAGEYERALEVHNLAFQSSADVCLRIDLLHDLGNDYWAIGDLERATARFRESLSLIPELEETKLRALLLAKAHEQIGNVLRVRCQFDEAFEEVRLGREALQISGVQQGPRIDWARAWLDLLEANIRLGQLLAGSPGYRIPWTQLFRAAKEFVAQQDDVCLAFVAERAAHASVVVADKQGVQQFLCVAEGLRKCTGSSAPPVDLREYLTSVRNQARVIFGVAPDPALELSREELKELLLLALRTRAELDVE
ncbi:MAG: AAA family ATPase [Armatimonadetes bacterium]|nr:AAA family ATPase [Armatimonadota bacterium]